MITIDKEKLAASAHDMLHLLAKAGQTIALNSPLLFDDQGRILGEICDMLNHIGGPGFADACGEDPKCCGGAGIPVRASAGIGPAMTPTPKPEPMSARYPPHWRFNGGAKPAARIQALIMGFRGSVPSLGSEGNDAYAAWFDALMWEVDRLSTALVAANVELVTLRSQADGIDARAERYAAALKQCSARHDEAERKLAVAVEALRTVKEKTGLLGQWRFLKEALAAITSDAPAKADTVDNGPVPAKGTNLRQQSETGTGPASKPLVVGQRYKLGELPVGAYFRFVGEPRQARLLSSITMEWGNGELRPLLVSDMDAKVELLSLPSAKADEGKSQVRDLSDNIDFDDGMDDDPAPPALTREEVRAIAEDAIYGGLTLEIRGRSVALVQHQAGGSERDVFEVDCADILRAALKEAP